MATQRKSTGTTPLFDMITEVYDTKKRMKAVINKVIETDSDDFEEYATYAHNCITKQWNLGWFHGYVDGWHEIFPDEEVPEEQYSEGFKEYATFTPSIPEYSTDTMTENLVIIMRDSLRCRLLLKDELETDSDEFVTYPDLLDELIVSNYQTAYDTAYALAYETAYNLGFPVEIYQYFNEIRIIPVHESDNNKQIYYYFNEDTSNVHYYNGPFEITSTCTITAYIVTRRKTTKECILIDWADQYLTFKVLDAGTLQIEYKRHDTTDSHRRVNWYNVVQETTGNANISGANVQISIPVNVGDYVSIYDNEPGLNRFETTSSIVKSSLRYNVMGNYRSIVGGESSSGTHPGTEADYLFYNDTHVLSAKNLIFTEYSSVYSKNYMFAGCTNLTDAPTSIDFEGQNNNDNASYMFAGCTRLTNISNMKCYGSHIFENCTALTTTGGFEGQGPYMFAGCTSLVDASGITIDERYVTAFRPSCEHMFDGCTSLRVLPTFNAIPAGDMNTYGGVEYMFYNCTSLTSAGSISLNDVMLHGHDFQYMFAGCTSLTTGANINVYRYSGGSSSAYSFYHMYDGCTRLTSVPNIDYIGYGEYCCAYMFNNCTSLTNASGITIIKYDEDGGRAGYSYSFSHMFAGCTSLTTLPTFELGESTDPNLTKNTFYLYPYEFEYMFYGCTSLTTGPTIVPEFPNGDMLDGAFQYMFAGCTSLTTGANLRMIDNRIAGKRCFYHMYDGCTSLTSVPNCLEGFTQYSRIAQECFAYMFYNCTRLNNVKCLLTGTVSISELNPTTNWLYGVSPTGTFTKSQWADSNTWSSGPDGIPSGWTIVDDVA